jgi:hypothetical protein
VNKYGKLDENDVKILRVAQENYLKRGKGGGRMHGQKGAQRRRRKPPMKS